jgi:Transposase DDE domain
MPTQISEEKLIQIFIAVHDFIQPFEQVLASRSLNAQTRQPTRQPDLAASEIITLLVYYHHSGYKNFQYYYERLVLPQMHSYFPKLVSYNRFVELLPRHFIGLQAFARYLSSTNQRTGCYFIDSKKLPVCHNRRIHSHRVFAELAGRGMSSTGWFYGLKLHLVINELGQIVNFCFTSANVADQNAKVLRQLLKGLQGRCYGDKGYLSKLFGEFYEQGLRLVTKVKRNMKNQLVELDDKIRLKKRALIESVNDILMSVQDIDHTRHRSPINALVHSLAGLVGYHFYDTKPSVYVKPVQG